MVAVSGFAFAAGRQLVSAQLLDEVLARIKASGLDAFSDSALFIKAARGLVHELNDPYANLYSPEQLADFRRNSLGNAYAGLGLGIERLDDTVTITAVFPGTPAASSGVQRGDRIVAVDGTPVVGWTTAEVSKRLMGNVGTRVRLTLMREGVPAPVTDELYRTTVHAPSVPYALMFDGHVGYVPLVLVNETAADEIRAAVTRLRDQGARAYVLDLRGNPGGELGAALDASNLFLDRGSLIVSVHSRAASPEVYAARSAPIDRDAPIVILEDGYTASAAEIIAGALQDHDRALVVGMPSFGKGLVQTMIPLDDGWLLKMTTGRWYTPSGRSIHRDRPFENGHFVAQDSAPLGTTATAIRAGRPMVQSAAGRVLYGGGGIVPDVVVPPDTLSDVDQHVLAALRGHTATARAVLYGLARDLKDSVRAGFDVRPEWRAMYIARLNRAGVVMNPALVDSARGFVDELIGERVADIAFGDSSAFRRNSAHDAQFRRALDLLNHATDVPALLKAGATSAEG